jgi:hypothetical protein
MVPHATTTCRVPSGEMMSYQQPKLVHVQVWVRHGATTPTQCWPFEPAVDWSTVAKDAAGSASSGNLGGALSTAQLASLIQVIAPPSTQIQSQGAAGDPVEVSIDALPLHLDQGASEGVETGALTQAGLDEVRALGSRLRERYASLDYQHPGALEVRSAALRSAVQSAAGLVHGLLGMGADGGGISRAGVQRSAAGALGLSNGVTPERTPVYLNCSLGAGANQDWLHCSPFHGHERSADTAAVGSSDLRGAAADTSRLAEIFSRGRAAAAKRALNAARHSTSFSQVFDDIRARCGGGWHDPADAKALGRRGSNLQLLVALYKVYDELDARLNAGAAVRQDKEPDQEGLRELRATLSRRLAAMTGAIWGGGQQGGGGGDSMVQQEQLALGLGMGECWRQSLQRLSNAAKAHPEWEPWSAPPTFTLYSGLDSTLMPLMMCLLPGWSDPAATSPASQLLTVRRPLRPNLVRARGRLDWVFPVLQHIFLSRS